MADMLERAVKMGVPPLKAEYHPVCSVSGGIPLGLRTILKLNSPDLGIMYPDRYRVVTNRNALSVKLAQWSFERALCDADELITGDEDEFLSVYFPTKMLLREGRDSITALYEAAAEKKRNNLSFIMPEFSSEILISDEELVRDKMNELHERFGTRFMLSEFGDSFCPISRLEEFPFEIVVLDSSICNKKSLGSIAGENITGLIKKLSMVSVLERTGDTELIRAAESTGVDAYCDIIYRSVSTGRKAV